MDSEAILLVEQKMGRNLRLFQKIELGFKLIHKFSDFDFTPGTDPISASLLRQDRTTLGELVRKFNEVICSPSENVPKPNKKLHSQKAIISANFRLQLEIDSLAVRQAELDSMVADRNNLVHHFLQDYPLTSIDECEAASRHLDDQFEKYKVELQEIQALFGTIQRGYLTVIDQMNSPEARKEMEYEDVRFNQLTTYLIDAARQHSRPDGWVVLSHVAQNIPNDIKNLKHEQGYQTLREFLQATHLFDLVDEQTAKGGVRIIYRLKPEWELQDNDESGMVILRHPEKFDPEIICPQDGAPCNDDLLS